MSLHHFHISKTS